MRKEAYYNKNKRKKKQLTYHLYNILDPLTKNLVKLKSFFRKNPFIYISFKFLLGIFAILLPMMLAWNNCYDYLINENSDNFKKPMINLNKNISNNDSLTNHYFDNLTENYDNNNTSRYYYSDFPNYNETNITILKTNLNKNSRKIFQINLTNTSNHIKNDKNFMKNYKNQFLKLNNLTNLDKENSSTTMKISEEVDLFVPIKTSLLLSILMLIGYVVYKFYHHLFVNNYVSTINFKLYGKILETSLIVLITYFSINNYNNFMIFYKNFQNKNLLFKTTEYQTLKSLHEKILLYNNYLEKNFAKTKKRKNSLLSDKINFEDEVYQIKNYSSSYDYNEKSFFNIAFNSLSDNIKNEMLPDIFPNKIRAINSKTYLKRRFEINETVVKNQTQNNLVNHTYFIFNIEDRAFNAILSQNLSEIFKSYLPVVIYLLLKVK